MHYSDIELNGIDENSNEKSYKLSDFKGENIIVYFYPEDDTPVCTQQAHLFRDAVDKLKKYARVIGISANDIKDHLEFKAKHNLNFILLSDKLNKLKEAFKEHAPNISKIQRSTFVLDKDGNIVKVWEKVDIDGHIDEITEFFENNKI